VYRRVEARGVFAFQDQRTEPNRSLRGLPGVYVVTPFRFSDGTGVLVQRGFAAAPDGRTVDGTRLLEPESTVVRGVLLRAAGRLAVHPESAAVGYPLLPLVIRRTERSPGMAGGLAIVGLPPLEAGPHLSYAIQWFAFATIALVGGVLLARRGSSPAPTSRRSP
jgi:cytochrome oxidase assembly protein ShyY1